MLGAGANPAGIFLPLALLAYEVYRLERWDLPFFLRKLWLYLLLMLAFIPALLTLIRPEDALPWLRRLEISGYNLIFYPGQNTVPGRSESPLCPAALGSAHFSDDNSRLCRTDHSDLDAMAKKPKCSPFYLVAGGSCLSGAIIAALRFAAVELYRTGRPLQLSAVTGPYHSYFPLSEKHLRRQFPLERTHGANAGEYLRRRRKFLTVLMLLLLAMFGFYTVKYQKTWSNIYRVYQEACARRRVRRWRWPPGPGSNWNWAIIRKSRFWPANSTPAPTAIKNNPADWCGNLADYLTGTALYREGKKTAALQYLEACRPFVPQFPLFYQ